MMKNPEVQLIGPPVPVGGAATGDGVTGSSWCPVFGVFTHEAPSFRGCFIYILLLYSMFFQGTLFGQYLLFNNYFPLQLKKISILLASRAEPEKIQPMMGYPVS